MSQSLRPGEAVNITATVDHAATAKLRWEQLPEDTRERVDTVTTMLRTLEPSRINMATLISFDAIMNEWLEPYGLAAYTEIALHTLGFPEPFLVTQITTLEAVREQAQQE